MEVWEHFMETSVLITRLSSQNFEAEVRSEKHAINGSFLLLRLTHQPKTQEEY